MDSANAHRTAVNSYKRTSKDLSSLPLDNIATMEKIEAAEEYDEPSESDQVNMSVDEHSADDETTARTSTIIIIRAADDEEQVEQPTGGNCFVCRIFVAMAARGVCPLFEVVVFL